MKKSVIILGGNSFNSGVVEVFRDLCYSVIVVDYRNKIEIFSDLHICFDATSPDIAYKIRNKYDLDVHGVYTSMDNAGLAQKSICECYGLFCAPSSALLSAHHKEDMHAKWQSAGLLGRESFSLADEDIKRMRSLNEQVAIIVKPTDSCASRGITILPPYSSSKALKKAFTNAKMASPSGTVNIEEFLVGQEYTVEILGDNFGNVSVYGISKKYHSKYTSNNSISVKLHYNPIDIPHCILEEISLFAQKCYRVLGLRNTLGHLEIIRKQNGEMSPIEIGARSSGFIASHLAGLATGRNYLEDFIEVQQGKACFNGLLPQSHISGMYFFYDIPDGFMAKKKTHLMQYVRSEIKSLYADRSRLLPGHVFKKISQDSDRYGYEVLVGHQKFLTIDEVKKAEVAFLQGFANEDVRP